MPRLPRMSILLLIAWLLPSPALRAQQPAPTAAPDQPTAKDVVKAVEKPEPPKPTTDPIERIKEEGLKRSQVMQTLSYLTDVIGPRLTGSPNLRRANAWTRDQLTKWGLQNAHLEEWGPFGRGWMLKSFHAEVVEPQSIPLLAIPLAWSPAVDVPLADVVLLDAKDEA